MSRPSALRGGGGTEECAGRVKFKAAGLPRPAFAPLPPAPSFRFRLRHHSLRPAPSDLRPRRRTSFSALAIVSLSLLSFAVVGAAHTHTNTHAHTHKHTLEAIENKGTAKYLLLFSPLSPVRIINLIHDDGGDSHIHPPRSNSDEDSPTPEDRLSSSTSARPRKCCLCHTLMCLPIDIFMPSQKAENSLNTTGKSPIFSHGLFKDIKALDDDDNDDQRRRLVHFPVTRCTHPHSLLSHDTLKRRISPSLPRVY